MKSFLALVCVALLFVATSNAQAECSTCTTVIGIVENWATSNSTDQEIIEYLETLCNFFPGFGAVCDSIAQQGIEVVIQWIEQNESPDEICQQLGLCTSEKTKLPSAKVIQSIVEAKTKFGSSKLVENFIKIHKPIPKLPADIECTGCNEVIGVIENWLDNTQDQQTVIDTVEVVCTYMPDWETTCDSIVETGVPVVVDWIIKYENSTVVCNQLDLC